MNIKELINEKALVLKEIYPKSEAIYILKLFLAKYFDISQARLILKLEKKTSTHLNLYLNNVVERLKQNEPFQYILGIENFYGYNFNVNSAVLIPRPETEELVALVLASFPAHKNHNGIDIGTGSGCIPIAIQKERPNYDLKAIDISKKAILVAESNNKLNNTSVNFELLNILDEKLWKEDKQYDFVVSNPPYIPHKEKNIMHKNVLEFEPHLALFVDDNDAIIFYSKIADFALKYLKPNGKLFFECNEYNAEQVKNMLAVKAFTNIELHQDMQGKNRMIKASIV